MPAKRPTPHFWSRTACARALTDGCIDGWWERRFFHTTPTLSKKVLGEYFGNKNNEAVLRVFVRQCDFSGKRIDEALRILLESFRLPGESQQIERVMASFANVYYAANPADVADVDAAFVLSYSIVMLNTDQVSDPTARGRAVRTPSDAATFEWARACAHHQHNPQVRKRMTVDDFVRNNRGINNRADFPRPYLEAIFSAIKRCVGRASREQIVRNFYPRVLTRPPPCAPLPFVHRTEIVMPDEHEGQVGDDYAWKKVLRMDKAVGTRAQRPRFT